MIDLKLFFAIVNHEIEILKAHELKLWRTELKEKIHDNIICIKLLNGK